MTESVNAAADPATIAAALVICSRNRPHLLQETIDSVLRGQAIPAELVIVDQSDIRHPSLTSRTNIGDCTLRYYWSPTTGVSRGRNVGAAIAHLDILVFIDDDEIVAPSWLACLVSGLERAGRRSVVTGRVLPTPSQGRGYFAPALVTECESATYVGRPGRDVLEAGNMAMFRADFLEIGGFDERLGPGTAFPAGEDNDFGLRLLETGYRIVYLADAVLFHQTWRARRDYLPLQFHYGLGQGAYYGKHFSLRDRYMLGRLGRLVLHHLYVCRLRVRHEPEKACGNLLFILGLLYGAVRWLLGVRLKR